MLLETWAEALTPFRGLCPRPPLYGAFSPTPRPTFSSWKKLAKTRIGGGHFRLCPPPKNHPPQRPKRGLRPPLWILPRTVLRGASTIEQRDWRICGGFQRGACAPLCVVVGEGYIREGPHRKGPSLVRLFGYFFGVEKVTRGVGLEAPLLGGSGVTSRKLPGLGRGGPGSSGYGARGPEKVEVWGVDPPYPCNACCL